MEINRKLNNKGFGKISYIANISPACLEVLNLFNQSDISYLTIKEVSTTLNISYLAAKFRLHKLLNKKKIRRIYSGAYCLPEKKEEIRLLPLYVRMNKHFTITIPAKIINSKNLKDQFVKIILEKDNKKSIFLTKTYYNSYSHQTYAFINEEIRNELNINPDDEIRMKGVNKISPFKPTEKMFYNNHIDLLSLIPEKTKKGFNFFVEEFDKDNEKWLNAWYHSTNCGSKQVWIKRFVNPEKLGRLLGILQAEGTKFERVKDGQSPRLIFTNKSIYEHKQFIGILNHFGIPKDIIKANVHYNPNKASYLEYKSYIDKFEKSTGIKPKTYEYINQEKLYYCIQIMIDRAALAELFLSAMSKVRAILANNEPKGILKKLGEGFLAKLLTGDGCLVIVKKKRGHVTQGYIGEKNPTYREDYRKILRKFGISVANWDANMRVYFKCNNENLKFLYEIKAFKDTRSWKKLIKAIFIKNGLLYQRFKRLNQFTNFTNQQFANLFGISLRAAIFWIRDKRKKDYIDIFKVYKNKHYYVLSKKARDLLDFLDNCKLELEKC